MINLATVREKTKTLPDYANHVLSRGKDREGETPPQAGLGCQPRNFTAIAL